MAKNYVYGSAAPARKYKAPERVQRQKPQSKTNKQIKVGALYTFCITMAVGAFLLVCAGYINNVNEQTANAREIRELQDKIADLKERNDQTEQLMKLSIDSDYIYRVAVEDLGMVKISSDKTIRYKSGESEYVIQYSE